MCFAASFSPPGNPGGHPQGAERVQELRDGGARAEPHLHPVSLPLLTAPRALFPGRTARCCQPCTLHLSHKYFIRCSHTHSYAHTDTYTVHIHTYTLIYTPLAQGESVTFSFSFHLGFTDHSCRHSSDWFRGEEEEEEGEEVGKEGEEEEKNVPVHPTDILASPLSSLQ